MFITDIIIIIIIIRTARKCSTTFWSLETADEASPERYCKINSFLSLANPRSGSPVKKVLILIF